MTTDKKLQWGARLAGFASGLLLGAIFVLLGTQPPAPGPISVRQLTEVSIKEDFKIQRRQQDILRATLKAAVVFRKHGCDVNYAYATGIAAVDFNINPKILAGLIFVESSCNPNSTDHRGSYGLTQVNTKVWPMQKSELKNPDTQIRFGAFILARYVHKYGLVEGLHHYNGYSDVHEHVYVNKVLTAAGMRAKVAKG